MTFSTQEELEACCREWQERLRLQDWTINIRFLTPNDMQDGAAGTNCTITALGYANIRINTWKQDYDGLPADHEQTLVHELLHIHFKPAFDAFRENKGLEYDWMERGIELTARTLVALKRSNPPPS